MGFQPALWVVILAVLVNLLSDLAGQYEDALHIPLSLRIIPMEDREAMYAFRQGASSILKILFQSSGAILAGLMSYQHLAFFNAGTFVVSALIMMILRPSLNKLLKDNPIHSSVENREEERHFIKNTWNSLQQSYQTIQNIFIFYFYHCWFKCCVCSRECTAPPKYERKSQFCIYQSSYNYSNRYSCNFGRKYFGECFGNDLIKKSKYGVFTEDFRIHASCSLYWFFTPQYLYYFLG